LLKFGECPKRLLRNSGIGELHKLYGVFRIFEKVDAFGKSREGTRWEKADRDTMAVRMDAMKAVLKTSSAAPQRILANFCSRDLMYYVVLDRRTRIQGRKMT
jgi:hypothetical protein